MRACILVVVAALAGCTDQPRDDGDSGIAGQPSATDASIPDAAIDPPDAAIDTPDAGPPPPVEIERALVWTDPELLDDATAIGLARVMSAVCPATPSGRVFEMWLRTFSTTAHSERAGPTIYADELASTYGMDSSAWPLDELPFKVTGIHNRIDLARDGHCGEFRVSMASTHPIYRPLHFIWLFRMQGTDCVEVARRFATLSTLEHDAFLAAARALLDEHLRPEHFLLAESVEFTAAPWEWRQWLFTESNGMCSTRNPPLFQQVDRPALNTPGPLRDDFLAFVDENAAALDARTLLIPERFRAPSARANQGVPWVPLDLTGISPSTAAAYPQLRQNIELVGCAACHVADAPFVQTQEDRTFSEFYRKELDARREHMIARMNGMSRSVPFGPLQPMPVLTP